jgi:hypothetical protein
VYHPTALGTRLDKSGVEMGTGDVVCIAALLRWQQKKSVECSRAS